MRTMPPIDTTDAFRAIQGVTGTPTAPVVEGRADRQAPLLLVPGQEVRGEVLAALQSNRFLVKIAGSLLDMNLPSTTRPGETVQLTYLGDKPRPTFTLGQQGNNAAPATVSDAGRWLTLLARTPAGQSLPLEDILKVIQHSAKGTVLVRGESTVPGEPPRVNLVPGQQARAEVMAEVPTGRFQVKVADALLEMNLPKATQTGSKLQLMLISDKPQLLFAMTQPSTHGQNTGTLNQIGRWLSFVSRVSAAETPAPPPAPLLVAPAGDGAEPDIQGLAGRLREALSRSGIFYESHVAEWAAGKTPVKELLLEPQGKLSTPTKATAPNIPTPQGEVREPVTADLLERSAVATSREGKPAEIADPQTLHIIRQQLSVLQHTHFIWQGEAWAGQRMDWSVEEREAENDGAPDRHWSTTLTLELPHLGRVSADLSLKGKQLQVTVQAGSPASTVTMRDQTQKLQEGLAAAGLTLRDLVITDER